MLGQGRKLIRNRWLVQLERDGIIDRCFLRLGRCRTIEGGTRARAGYSGKIQLNSCRDPSIYCFFSVVILERKTKGGFTSIRGTAEPMRFHIYIDLYIV
jgi:hypothetical protein